ncbi:hypothetical protein [Mycoplana sp. MJR14]|uniref:hypothetical protein n=1 Tax=Mycoplana sp. MJR14 TaxID=3032583 RepID=UPI0023DBB569|nr:hypothetical protein [Mycoplana sp. MJR14]MDF1631879.1 hypothetical protein [Mycoplana sp. MJR14]
MLSAISNINGAAHQLAAERLQQRSARSDAAAAALAALSPVRPLPSVSDRSDDDGQALSFLYGPGGYPALTTSQPGEAAAQSADASSAPARIAMESTQMTALLSSLMTPTAPAPKQTGATAPAQVPAVASESLISKLYRQF